LTKIIDSVILQYENGHTIGGYPMSKAVKFAVSIPGSEFKELETLRKKKGLNRSEFIRETLRLWKKAKEEEKLVRVYREGYKRVPENLADVEAWEKASLSSMSREEW
jgi:Arc/MetJ-type ribon-helix-helix transcriptional regulator